MAAFVIDASATLPWCLKDEQTAWTIDLLRCLNTGDRIVVPAHWAVELSNALLMATRRKRIPEGRAILFLDELAVLPISAEPPLSSVQAKSVFALCEHHNLTFYDGAYLETRKAAPLAFRNPRHGPHQGRPLRIGPPAPLTVASSINGGDPSNHADQRRNPDAHGTNTMPTIAILGPGAIGCTVGATLAETTHHTVLFCGNTPFPRLHITFPTGDPIDQPATVLTEPPPQAPQDWLLLCVKAQQVPATAPWLRALVGPHTHIAILQNGVEHRDPITQLVGDPTRILPVVVQIPAERTAPGTVTLAAAPYLVVPEGPLAKSFRDLFAHSRIRVDHTPNFLEAAWEKLCLNATNGAITALTEQDQSVLRQPEVAELALQIVRECIAVGRAEGATLPGDLPETILSRLAGPPGTPGGGNSMLYDRLAGRELEADARNGVIVRLGQKHGIPTPINAALYALLKNIKTKVAP